MEKQPFILIAEDDQEDQFLLTNAFQIIGHSENIHFVEDGKEVLDYLGTMHRNNYSSVLIVLDIAMPSLNGIETLSCLKINEVYKEIPVIILTSSANENEKRKLLEIGAAKFITKPARFHQMIETAKLIYDSSKGAIL
jgi:CheY-like chemotaxis protein